MHQLSITACSKEHTFGLARHRHKNNNIYHMKAKVTFFLNKIITQKLISVTKAWFLTCYITYKLE